MKSSSQLSKRGQTSLLYKCFIPQESLFKSTRELSPESNLNIGFAPSGLRSQSVGIVLLINSPEISSPPDFIGWYEKLVCKKIKIV